jgi:hypothetical protein
MDYETIGAMLLLAMALSQGSLCSAANPTTFSGSGGNNTSVTRAARMREERIPGSIGGADNGNGTARMQRGFRSISWDGVAGRAGDAAPAAWELFQHDQSARVSAADAGNGGGGQREHGEHVVR